MFDPQFLSLPTMPDNPRFIQFEPNNYRVKKTNYVCEQETENTTRLRKVLAVRLIALGNKKILDTGGSKIKKLGP